MNELAMVFDRLNIDSGDVIEAAATKWNFMSFTPGLVGGHCIGVDPYYLTYRAVAAGCSPQVILAGRSINDGMAAFVAGRLLSALTPRGADTGQRRVTVLGFTFKENVPDTRNTAVADLVRALQQEDVVVQVHDPLADPGESLREYGISLQDLEALQPGDAVVVAVPHAPYRERGWELATRLLRGGTGVVYDLKGILDRNTRPEGVKLLRL
jgi:UDP-N-acetyl-D-galactosamine dehydrogenase